MTTLGTTPLDVDELKRVQAAIVDFIERNGAALGNNSYDPEIFKEFNKTCKTFEILGQYSCEMEIAINAMLFHSRPLDSSLHHEIFQRHSRRVAWLIRNAQYLQNAGSAKEPTYVMKHRGQLQAQLDESSPSFQPRPVATLLQEEESVRDAGPLSKTGNPNSLTTEDGHSTPVKKQVSEAEPFENHNGAEHETTRVKENSLMSLTHRFSELGSKVSSLKIDPTFMLVLGLCLALAITSKSVWDEALGGL
ncbi:MAG: hypothetical protein Q9171_006967 [Xanthocarpia ochracea]